MICSELKIAPEEIKMISPREAVASGAAIYANRLEKGPETLSLPPEFRGVSGYFTGVRALNPGDGEAFVDVLIDKNLPLPAKVSRTYYTSAASQEYVFLEIVQFIENPADAFSIGDLLIGPLKNPRANYMIEVVLEYAATGEIALQVFDPQTGTEIARTFTNRENEVHFLLEQKQLVRNTRINNLP